MSQCVFTFISWTNLQYVWTYLPMNDKKITLTTLAVIYWTQQITQTVGLICRPINMSALQKKEWFSSDHHWCGNNSTHPFWYFPEPYILFYDIFTMQLVARYKKCACRLKLGQIIMLYACVQHSKSESDLNNQTRPSGDNNVSRTHICMQSSINQLFVKNKLKTKKISIK